MKLRRLFVGLFPAAAVAAILLGPTYGEERTWTDRTGKHKIEAEFVRFKDGKVSLRKSNGKVVKFPIEKLSKSDQAFVRKIEEKQEKKEKKPATAKSPIEDRKTVRSISKKFFEGLRKERKKAVRATLTGDARSRYDDEESAVNKLPKPDAGAAIRVGRMEIEDESATAEVRVRVDGKYQVTTLHFRRESEKWLVHAISATGADGDLVTFDFEETGDAAGERPGDAGDADDGRFDLPDGDPQELLAFVKKLKNATPPSGLDRAGARKYVEKVSFAVLEAVEKILAGEPSGTQIATAANHGLDACRSLIALRASGMSERLADFQKAMERLDLADLTAKTKTLVLLDGLNHLGKGSESDARDLFAKIERHLRTVDLGRDEAGLANLAGQIAERIGPEVAGEVNESLGQLLADRGDVAIARIGAQMLGAARRFQLVGNPMHLEGYTLDGEPFDISEFEGKVVLVDFWATWCGPCIQEMPNILSNYAEYHDLGFEVVAISVDNNLKALEKYVEKEEPPWTILADYHKKVDADNRMSTYYGISGIPTTILIGPDGNVVSLNCRGKRLGAALKRLLGRSGDRASDSRNSRSRS